MYFFAGILPTLRPILSLIVVKAKTMVSSMKPYQSFTEVGTYGMYDKERRNVPGNKQSKNWSPLHDNNNNQHGDSFALVEYTQNITSGEDDVMAVDHKKIEQGIRRTQEVVVTRDTI
jgi:predicted ribonuclease toxin of YeeF-YezG toxin-antitoxin module